MAAQPPPPGFAPQPQPGYQQAPYPPQGGAGYPPSSQPPVPQAGGYQQQPGPPPPQQQPPQGQGGQQQQPNLPAYKGEVPDEDVHESNAQGPDAPSAPPISSMDRVAGYESVTMQGDAYIPPPAYAQTAAPDPGQGPDIQPNIPTISEDVARNALMDEIGQHCCYGKGAAQNLVFTNIQPSSAFHYQLETFTEGRTTTWAYEPFNGQVIDGPQNGPAPGPWDIAAQPNGMFSNHDKSFEVPHTASVKSCHNCMGVGMNRCWRCHGRGRVICGSCNGTGRHLRTVVHHDHHHHHHGHHHHGHHHHHHHGHSHVDTESVPCLQCNGSGRKRCWTCHGCGQVECQLCRTRGQLKCYIKLTVAWKTHKNDHVVERTALPDELIRGAQGQEAFKDQRPRVAPVATFPDQAVNDASRRLVDAHSTSFPTERILMQRHWIRIVPVSEVQCDYKGSRFSYWVYGHNNLVFNPDYPQKWCWGCTVL